MGWALDFLALGITAHAGVNHPTLGFLHAGFYDSAMSIWPDVRNAASAGPYALAGHSLGAALALLLGGLLIDAGKPPLKIGAFAPPRVGSDPFVKVVTSVPYCAYRYRDDPVPMVPFRLMPPPPAPQFPYRQVPFIQLGTPSFEIDETADHAIGNYVANVAAYQAAHST